MSFRFSTRGEELVAAFWWEPPPHGRRVPISDEIEASAYLDRLATLPGELVRARALAGHDLSSSDRRLDDAELLRQLGRWLVTGKLSLWSAATARLVSVGDEEEEPPSAPLFVRSEPAPVIEVAPEETTFSPAARFELIAAILREAAKSGVPFCEECLEKKLEVKAMDPDTFPEDLDAMAAAAVMSAAAATGVPFCEECMKDRLSESRAKGSRPSS